jgi:hypothetical protein
MAQLTYDEMRDVLAKWLSYNTIPSYRRYEIRDLFEVVIARAEAAETDWDRSHELLEARYGTITRLHARAEAAEAEVERLRAQLAEREWRRPRPAAKHT